MSDFQIELTNYKVVSTGANGGHIYLTTEIDYKGEIRKLVVYVFNKSDKNRLLTVKKVKLRGQLLDEGSDYSLSLLDTFIVSEQVNI